MVGLLEVVAQQWPVSYLMMGGRAGELPTVGLLEVVL